MMKILLALKIALVSILFSVDLYAQQDSDTLTLTEPQMIAKSVVARIEVERDSIKAETVESPWVVGVLNQVGFSQLALSNWAEGGDGQVAFSFYVDANFNYAKDKMIWENRVKLGYAFAQTFDTSIDPSRRFKKNDDKVQIDSKWGYKMVENLYFTSALNFRSQIAPGYDYSTESVTRTSQFMSPGYVSLGLGFDYKPIPSLSCNISPLTGNLVVVNNEALRVRYGNDINQPVRPELGAQVKIDYRKTLGVFTVGTTLMLFYDYLNVEHPDYVQVYWDLDLAVKLTKYLTATLRTNLIWDQNILFPSDTNPQGVPRVQFKEILGFSFTYQIGDYKKE